MSAHILCSDAGRSLFLLTLTRFYVRYGCFAAFLVDCPIMPWRKGSGMPVMDGAQFLNEADSASRRSSGSYCPASRIKNYSVSPSPHQTAVPGSDLGRG
jgi:hypothetical protein